MWFAQTSSGEDLEHTARGQTKKLTAKAERTKQQGQVSKNPVLFPPVGKQSTIEILSLLPRSLAPLSAEFLFSFFVVVVVVLQHFLLRYDDRKKPVGF